jgi:hypothetical protein
VSSTHWSRRQALNVGPRGDVSTTQATAGVVLNREMPIKTQRLKQRIPNPGYDPKRVNRCQLCGRCRDRRLSTKC